MTYTEIQLEAIKILGRKDLTEGCIIRHFYDGTYGIFLGYSNDKSAFDVHISYDGGNTIDSPDASDIRKCILGHIPHLEDLFRVAEERNWMVAIDNQYQKLFIDNKNGKATSIPYNPTLPFIDQPSLPDILNLFK